MSKRKIERGSALVEQKGSLDYAVMQIRRAFYKAFDPNGDRPMYVREIFSDHVIVEARELQPEEFYFVPFARVNGAIEFAPREQWEVVELAYVPQTQPLAAEAKREALAEPARKFKLEERRQSAVTLEDADAGRKGPRRIRINEAIVADVVNANRRRYPLPVLRAAVSEIVTHLHESAGNGRAILLGEAEHPSDKASGRPSLMETVVKWTDVSLDEASGRVSFAGHILETSKGKDILALCEGGVLPGGSLRGYGLSRSLKDETTDERIEEVTELHLTGYDLVLEPAFANQAVLESKQNTAPESEALPARAVNQNQMEGEMTPEQLKAMIEANPDLFKGVVAAEVEKWNDAQRQAFEETARAALGLDATADVAAALKDAAEAKKTLAEQERKAKIAAAIAEATKGLPYGNNLNAMFAEELAASAANAESVKPLAEALKKRYDAMVAETRMAQLGFNAASVARNVQVLGPVIERETGTPEYAGVSFQLLENMRARGDVGPARKPENMSINERVAAQMVKKFDAVYAQKLIAEQARFNEATATSDLSLPYSVSRTITAAVWPRLVAASVFDIAPMDANPTLLFYEYYAEDSTSLTSPAITDEAVTGPNPLGGWVNVANKSLKPGTVVLTNSGGGTTYTENTDYFVDYGNGRIFVPSSGSAITAGQSLLIDYEYDAFRRGESQPIERGKATQQSVTMTAIARRLGVNITNEAVEFSRSQLGYDVVARNLAMVTNELARKLDQELFYLALAKARTVASNTTTAWNGTASTPDYQDGVTKIGKAKVKVMNRWYEPTFVLMSSTNADLIANWSGFTQSGSRADADLNATGFFGRLKGIAAFDSPQMPDTAILVGNREQVALRVFKPFALEGPYPAYATSGDATRLLASKQWYAEQYDAFDSPVAGKASIVPVT